MEALNISMLLLFFSVLSIADGGFIGVNYGRLGDNLPAPKKVVQLLKSHGFDHVKIFDADQAVLKAFSSSDIKLTICVPNQLLQNAAHNSTFATQWVSKNVAPYKSTNIEAIAIGNEVLRDKSMTSYLVPALQNFYRALQSHELDHIKVSSPLAYEVFVGTYPPSSGSFDSKLVKEVFQPMLDFLRMTNSPLMVNVYTFITYKINKKSIALDYALARNSTSIVTDRGNQKKYTSLFDAQVDAVFAALSRLNYDDIPIVISETGWPSKGGPDEVGASIANAATYTRTLVRKVLNGGTPLKPKVQLTIYLFALFNENKKTGPLSEKNFGLFYPNQTEVYDISFLTKGDETEGDKSNGQDAQVVINNKPNFAYKPNVADEPDITINKPNVANHKPHITNYKPHAARIVTNNNAHVANNEPDIANSYPHIDQEERSEDL